MRRVVIDTNLYIDWFNAGRHETVLFQQDAVKYLSTVVVLELYAGASTPRDRRTVSRVVSAFERAGRILVPTGAVFQDAGHVVRVLHQRRGLQPGTPPPLINDVLIALSARAIGATVVTANARDFTAIQAVRPFALTVVPG